MAEAILNICWQNGGSGGLTVPNSFAQRPKTFHCAALLSKHSPILPEFSGSSVRQCSISKPSKLRGRLARANIANFKKGGRFEEQSVQTSTHTGKQRSESRTRRANGRDGLLDVRIVRTSEKRHGTSSIFPPILPSPLGLYGPVRSMYKFSKGDGVRGGITPDCPTKRRLRPSFAQYLCGGGGIGSVRPSTRDPPDAQACRRC